MTDALLIIAALLVTGIGCQWLAWRLRIPAILFLLLTGVLAGPLLGWLRPDMLFGDLLFPFVSLSVALILFEGGLTVVFALKAIAGLDHSPRDRCGCRVIPVCPAS